jgi:3-oxoadipate enol-lactonase
MPAMTRYLDVPGGRLAYDVTGSGPTVVLMHAWIADRRMWDDVVPELSKGRQVVRYDKRGYGQTEIREAVRYSNRRDVISVLDAVSADQAALVGVSGGGTVALDTALEFPDRINSLVLVAPGISGFEWEEGEAVADATADMERLWEAHDWEALVEAELRVWVDGLGEPPDRIPRVREQVREMNLAAYVDHADEPEGEVIPLVPPALGRLGEVRAPTLVVVGDLDTPGTLAASERIERDVPGARRVVMPGVAHLPPMERPGQFTTLVSAFLGESKRR